MTKIPYTAIYDIDFNDFEAGGSRRDGAEKMREIVERWANSDAGQAQFRRILDARQAGMLPDAHFPIKVVERRGLNSFDDLKTMTVGFDPVEPTRIMTKTGSGAEGYTMQISDPAAIFGHETEHYLTFMLRQAKGIKKTPQNEFCLKAEEEKLSVDVANAYRKEKGQPLRHGYSKFMIDRVAGMKNWFKDTTGMMDKFVLPKVRKDYADPDLTTIRRDLAENIKFNHGCDISEGDLGELTLGYARELKELFDKLDQEHRSQSPAKSP